MNNLPYVSIIVAVYNGEKTIEECIYSLLSQDYPKDKYEIIVADNNSTDRTTAIIKRFPVRHIIEDKIQGPSAARNAGAEIAKGDVFLFFDADQVAEKDWIRRILEGWEDKKNGAFAGRNIGTNTKGSLLGEYWVREWSQKTNNNSLIWFNGGNAAIRKELFERLNGFDISIPTCEDIDLAWRIQKELGLFIKYNKNAIAYHRERQDLRGLLKREFYLGYGSCILAKKHQEAKKTILISVIKAMLRTILGCIALVYGIFRPLKNKNRKRHLQLILLDITMQWSNCLGRLYSKFKLRRRQEKCH